MFGVLGATAGVPGHGRSVSSTPGLVDTRIATPDDAGEILTVQRAAFVVEAQRYGEPDLPPLTETIDEVRDVISSGTATVLVAEIEREDRRRIVGSGRLAVRNRVGHVGRLAVTPDLQGSGIGSSLLNAIHARVDGVEVYELSTGAESANTLRWYAGHGYEQVGSGTDAVGVPLAVMRRPVFRFDGGRTARVACHVTRKGSDDILVLEHAGRPGGLEVPSGQIEPGEAISSAAVREVLHKTGLADARFVALLGFVDDGGTPTAYVHLEVEYAPDTWEHVDTGITCRWASPASVPNGLSR